MLSFRLVNGGIQNKIIQPSIYKCILQSYCSDSDSENNKVKTRTKPIKKDKTFKSNEASEKLNVLLKRMIDDNSDTNKLNLAKPKPKIRNDKTEQDSVSTKSEIDEQKIINAAKNVAQSLGGNTKQIESELLSKLLNTTASNNEEDLKTKPLNLSDVISGMKIDRTEKPNANNEVSRAHQVRRFLDRSTGKQREDFDKRRVGNIRKPIYSPQLDMEKIDLFGSKPLGIFVSEIPETKQESPKAEETVLKTWNALQERELRLAVTHPPENYFQEMILWTEQGKVWKFPIDNEQGMEEEQNVYFAEHVFLDKHLENWCPTKGPIRHFMELVCVGLSKNPYLSAQAKKDHIMWFKDYFLSKKQLLEEIGALPTTDKPKEIKQ